MKGFTLLLLFWFLGAVCSPYLPILVPAPILGAAFLFLALSLKVVPIGPLIEPTQFLLGNLAIFFIPAAVGLLDVWDLLKDQALLMVAIAFVTTFLTLLFTGGMMQIFMKYRGHEREEEL